jgi:uncharacterized protein DUF4136
MQISRLALALTLAAAAAATTLAQKVTTELEPGTNLHAYKTFMWIKQPNVTDPILKQRVIDDIDAQLTTRGYTLVSSGADLGVAAHLATRTQKSLNTFYDGFGGGWRWGGTFGSATTTVNTYEEGTLVVDLFDAGTKRAIWRGTAAQEISSNPKKETDTMAKAAQKMFEKFPG